MKLTTKFFIGSALVILLTIAFGLGLFITDRQVKNTFAKSKIVDETVSGMVELSILTSDYLLSPTERASSQWYSKHKTIASLLDTATFNDPEEQLIIQKYQQGLVNIRTIFSQLVENQQATNEVSSDIRQQLDEQLAGQISIELQKTLSLTSQLKALSQESIDSASQLSSYIRTAFLILLLIFIITIPLLTNSTVIRPITNLTRVAEEISQGNLDVAFSGAQNKDEIGVLTHTLEQMTVQLRETLQGLEERIAKRTRALQTSTEVSRRISTILNQDQLAKTVVEELVSSFGYYYAHIYRFEDDDETLVMKGGTGEVGQILLARGHTIKKGLGLVGRAAETNSVVLVGDTLNEEGWLPNELLPETRSEIAVPIALGNKVLGVFDVQHNVVDGFTEEDAELLQSLANQIAIASQNAQVYVKAQQQATREILVGDIGQKIQNTTTIEEALQVAVRELGLALNAKRAKVQLNLKVKDGQGKA